MTRGTYIGVIKHLRGKTALLRIANHGHVEAQFDDRSLRRDTAEAFDFEPPNIMSIPSDALGFGWHSFWSNQFYVEPTPLGDWQDPHAMPMRSDRSHLGDHS